MAHERGEKGHHGKWRPVFNIAGNKYRLIVDMRYD
ncbi:MAG: type II toxin-antitoxin system HigB family toxin [Candidatus Entotheonellia bacterium]